MGEVLIANSLLDIKEAKGHCAHKWKTFVAKFTKKKPPNDFDLLCEILKGGQKCINLQALEIGNKTFSVRVLGW